MARSVETPVNVLVVDDREENRLALRAVLGNGPYRILEAAGERDALRHLLREEVAVILLDVVLPGMNGFELAEFIKAREKTASTPIIFLTAEAVDPDLIRRGYAVGAVDYLTKPLMPEVVRGKVAVFSQLYRQRRQIEDQAQRLLEAERKDNDFRLMELRLIGERRYRSLAEAVPHIVWTAHPDGRPDYFNRRWYEFTGLAGNTEEGWLAAVHPDDHAECEQLWRQALERREAFSAECRIRRGQDAGYRWHLVRGLPEQGQAGAVTSWLGTFTDIDDQKRVEQVLAEFKGMLDAVLDAVLILDQDQQRMLYVNEGACQLLGYSAEQLMAFGPQQFLAAEDLPRLSEAVAQGRATLETHYRCRDGSSAPVELSVQRVQGPAGPVVLIARDISERRRAEAEREFLYNKAVDAVRARDEFLSVASHELRTPLTSLSLQIAGLLRGARRNADSWSERRARQVADKLEGAERQVGRLARLIDQLLDISRMNAGQFSVDAEELDLVELVQEVSGRLRDTAGKAGCELVLKASGPVVGHWDRLRLEQVVTNLVTNAVKFGAGKPIEISIGGDATAAQFAVRDHGIGVSAEAKERIFQRFEQAAPAREYGGLGLGLYIVQRIVAAHGGAVELESAPDEGALFKVTLPRRWPVAAATEQEEALA